MARTTNGRRTPTRGGELLAKCPDSEREIAAKVGVSASLVARWKSGQRKPTDAQILKLEELYGIPRSAWQEPPSKATSKAPKRKQAPTPPPSPPDVGDEDDDETTMARLHRYIRDGLRELEADAELSGVKRAEALKKLVDARVSLDKSTGENAITIAKIVAHPQFKHAVQTIVDAIAPYPEALAAATKALEAVIAKS